MTLTRIFLLTGLFVILQNSSGNAQSFQWLSRIGGPSYDPSPLRPDELANDIATDQQGNVYVIGRTRNNSNINGVPINTYGGNDIYLAKFDCFGTLVWARTAGNPDDGDNGVSLALDGLGHIYITGEIYGTSGPSGQINFFDTIYHINSENMFLAKFDTNGNFIWGKIAFLESSSSISSSNKIAIDSHGKINVLLGAIIPGEIFPGINTINSIYIARFDTSGVVEKMTSINENHTARFQDFKLSSNNEFYLIGHFFNDSVTIGGQTLYRISPQNSYDFFCIKLDTLGIAHWNIHYGFNGSSFSFGYGCVFDTNGDLLITGSAYNGLVLGPDTLLNSLSPTTPKDFPFIAKVNPNGQILWARNLHLQYIARSTGGISVKSNGNAVISGFYSGPIIIGPDSFSGIGTHNFFIAEISNNGTILHGEPVPTNSGGSDGEPRRTVCDAADNVIFAGAFDGNLIVNGNLIPYAGGYTDGFLIKWGSALCTVGIDDMSSSIGRNVLLYPNPATYQIRFKFTEALSNETVLVVYDVMGRSQKEIHLATNTIEYLVELDGLSQGLYYYSVQSKDLNYGGKFLIVKD